jgi:hypothetical protein
MKGAFRTLGDLKAPFMAPASGRVAPSAGLKGFAKRPVPVSILVIIGILSGPVIASGMHA